MAGQKGKMYVASSVMEGGLDKAKTQFMKINTEFLPFSLPLIEDDEIEEILDTLKSGWITTGPKTKRFEEKFSEYIGCKHAIAVNSCTAALNLSLEAIGLKEGDEVITTPMTFAATAEVIRYFKAKPVFIDIDPINMNISTDKVEEYLSNRFTSQSLHLKPNASPLKAIIPVHFAGYPCEMDRIQEISCRYNLKVIEDAAHAFPAFYNGKIIGKIGDITCFSFYATKNITTGEGGMITTDNDEWADRMRIMSLHGISKDAWARYTAEGNWYYEIIAPGYKYNLTDIAAALGLAQLRKAEKLWQRRTEIAMMYNKAFKDSPEIETPLFSLHSLNTPYLALDSSLCNACASNPIPSMYSDTRHSWHLYVIKLNLEYLTIDRNRFIEELKKRGIGTSVHFIPLHIHPYYRNTFGYKPKDFPIAYETYKRIISLPIYPKMTNGDVERVIEAILAVISKNSK